MLKERFADALDEVIKNLIVISIRFEPSFRVEPMQQFIHVSHGVIDVGLFGVVEVEGVEYLELELFEVVQICLFVLF